MLNNRLIAASEQAVLPKPYTRGTYMVRPDHPEREQIEAYITQSGFLNLDDSQRIPTRNRQHRLYSFHLPAIDREVMLKIHWLDPSYSRYRRLEIWLSHMLKNRCERSFYGALALKRAGINTLTPLAYWSCKRTWLHSESYLLYEKIPADYTLLDYRRRIQDNMTLARRHRLDRLIEEMAEAAAAMHSHHLRHGDLAFGNFLVHDLGKDSVLYIIDTDQVSASRSWGSWLKRVLDLKSLKPIHLDAHERRVFLKKYLGKNYTEFWLKVFLFWQKGKYRFFRRAYKWLLKRKQE